MKTHPALRRWFVRNILPRLARFAAMPELKVAELKVLDLPSQIAALDAIDRRQEEILSQLDALNDRILGVLSEHGVAPPKLPPQFQPKKSAA
jgi:hypothetical protein